MSAFKNLELANDVMDYAQKLDFDFLLEAKKEALKQIDFLAEFCTEDTKPEVRFRYTQ